jgi:hypothetical protein
VSQSRAPYGVNANGHANICDCVYCSKLRALFIERRAEETGLGGHLHTSKTVYVASYMVKAHFRRNARHLDMFPNTKAAVQSAIRKALVRK